MVKLHVFVREETAEEIRAIAMDWDAPVSLVLRVVLEDLLAHPERLPALLAPHLITEDTRTDAQRASAERAIAVMMQTDLEAIARQLGG